MRPQPVSVPTSHTRVPSPNGPGLLDAQKPSQAGPHHQIDVRLGDTGLLETGDEPLITVRMNLATLAEVARQDESVCPRPKDSIPLFSSDSGARYTLPPSLSACACVATIESVERLPS